MNCNPRQVWYRLASMAVVLAFAPMIHASSSNGNTVNFNFSASGAGANMMSQGGNAAKNFGDWVLSYGLYALMAIAVLLAAYFYFFKKEIQTALYFLGGLVFVAAIKLLITYIW